MSARPDYQEAVPLHERPAETLHVSLVVSSDSATTVPTTHLRERFSFRSAGEWRAFDTAVRVWLAQMPTLASVREQLLQPAPAPARRRETVGQALGRILLDGENLDEPAPLPDVWVYDREADRP